jgi:DNA invertase Pin-like site-specific DNA recombinase
MTLIGFARTTINDSDLESQIITLRSFGCETIYHEAFEGGSPLPHEADLATVVGTLQKDDCLVISHLYRLGKSTRQLTDFTHHFKELGIQLVSLAENIDTRQNGSLYFNLMDGLATMEQQLIKERTLVGLNEARKKGKIGGRPKIGPATIQKIRSLYFEDRETIQQISLQCNVSVGTCYKYINLPETEVEKLFNEA